ncbi:hypothetical protein HAX54_010549 [Datura stramonium]|uniref:Uncharacterized protein n=1 Tax=Datura stramonium TaxID=4076 RepID=A0ABS8TI13_DATST|nr:hypothetical protein [Datura stramonium]
MSAVVSPLPSFAPFAAPPVRLESTSQLSSPPPVSQPNVTAPPVSSSSNLTPNLLLPASPPLPQSPPPSNVLHRLLQWLSHPQSISPPTNDPPPTSSPPPLPRLHLARLLVYTSPQSSLRLPPPQSSPPPASSSSTSI